MKTLFVVTTIVKEGRGSKQVTLGAYTDRQEAEQAAEVALITEGGVLCDLITWRTENGYDTEIVKRVEGNTTTWGKWCEGADWHTTTSFWMAAKVDEITLIN